MSSAKCVEDLVKRRWNPDEDAILRSAYANEPREDVLARLPGRSWASVTRRAHELGVRRSRSLSGNAGNVVAPVFVRDGVAGKACVRCLDWKPLEKFAHHATCAGGRRNTCTTCEGSRAYLANPGRCIAQTKKYQATHPEMMRVIRRNGRARRYERLKRGLGVTSEEYEEIRARFGGYCAYCKAPSANVFDHVIPLARGGEHAASNLVLACTECNASKHAKTPDEWSAWKAKKRSKETS